MSDDPSTPQNQRQANERRDRRYETDHPQTGLGNVAVSNAPEKDSKTSGRDYEPSQPETHHPAPPLPVVRPASDTQRTAEIQRVGRTQSSRQQIAGLEPAKGS